MFYIICKVKNDNAPSHLRYWIVWSEYKERKEYKTFSLNIHPDNFKFELHKLETFKKSDVDIYLVKINILSIITKINEFINSSVDKITLFNKTFIKEEDGVKVIRDDNVCKKFSIDKLTYEDLIFFSIEPNLIKV